MCVCVCINSDQLIVHVTANNQPIRCLQGLQSPKHVTNHDKTSNTSSLSITSDEDSKHRVESSRERTKIQIINNLYLIYDIQYQIGNKKCNNFRNLTIGGGPSVCQIMIDEDVMTPLIHYLRMVCYL